MIADLRLWQGKLEEALANAEQARNRFRRLGDKLGLIQSLSAVIRAQVATALPLLLVNILLIYWLAFR